MFNERIPRRRFIKATAFLGSAAALGTTISSAFHRAAEAALHLKEVDNGTHRYDQNKPENIIYSTCLQCHTACPIKCKVLEGVLVKIEGNPYCPQTLIPNVSYNSPVAAGAPIEGKICLKGHAGIETLYDPYRIRKVLKRNGPRGSNQWKTISFNQAIDEVASGGKLFADIGEDRHVPGFKDVYALRDPKVSADMAKDVKEIQKKKMSVAQFKEKYKNHLSALMDPDHPDLGPKNNQFVFLAGRIEHGRKELMKRFTFDALGSVNAFEHTTICEQSHHIAFEQMTNEYKDGKWQKGKHHMKPDLSAAEYVIFFGTGVSEANFGPPILSGLLSDAVANRKFKYVVVDPRLSKTAGKADRWIPIKPGMDGAFALGMIRWIIDSNRYDKKFLESSNKAAASAVDETCWTTATYLVKLEGRRPNRYLRASDVGLGTKDQFVVSQGGELKAVTHDDKENPVQGDLFAKISKDGIEAVTVFQLLKDRAAEKSLAEYAKISGVSERDIIELAKEFTSHGKKAVVEFYRGPVQHTNGYYNAQALITLNLLIGNPDWKGGLAKGGSHWHEFGGKEGNVYSFKEEMHPGKLTAFGIKSNREKAKYEESTLFKGYPAKRPFYPFTGNLYQEVIPSAAEGYPYPIQILYLHKGTPVLSCPAGHRQIEMLTDPKKIPLFIASDIVIGETTMYADYVFPDLSVWERWGTPHITPAMLTPVSKVRQPVVAPLVETVKVDGEEMPVCMESFLIAVGKKIGLSGIGKDAFGKGMDFNRLEDFYLKAVANMAMGDKIGDAVPEASDEEMNLFLKARKHLPKSVFDPAKWERAAGSQYWRRVVYVLNRGGRFEDSHKMHKGEKQAHPLKGMFSLYAEPVATARDSMTGKYFDGLPKVEPIRECDGAVVEDDAYPLTLITYKEVFGGHSRTMPPDLWLGELLKENAVLINRVDAEAFGLQEGDTVRITSKTNPEGRVDLKDGRTQFVQGPVKMIEGIRPGVIAVSWHFGHWAYGSQDIKVDGVLVKGDPSRARGLCPNPVMREDAAIGGVCLTDPIGGSATFFNTSVILHKV